MRSLFVHWTHNAVQEIATMHHNTAAWSDIVCSPVDQAEVLALATARHIAGMLFNHHPGHLAPELRTDAALEAVGGGPVDENPPDMFLELFEKEDDEPELLEHEVPEAQDAHEEAPIPVLNRLLALRIVYGDGLRRIPSATTTMLDDLVTATTAHGLQQPTKKKNISNKASKTGNTTRLQYKG